MGVSVASRHMKHTLLTTFVVALTGISNLVAADETAPNTLTAGEKAAGWRLLFNGQDLKGWSNFKRDTIKPGWQVKDGTLA